MKKLIVIIIVLTALFISLTGCNVKNKNGNNAKGDSLKEHYTFTITSNQPEENVAKSASFKYLKEKFNVDFQLYFFTESNWSQKVRIWMASGDTPDIMQAPINNQNYNEYLSWISQGLLKEIPNLADYKNLSKMKENCIPDKYFQQDGKNYAWISYNPDLGFDSAAPYGFIYRADWARQLGKEKDVYTWEEFVDLAKAFKEMQKSNMRFYSFAMDAGVFPHGAGIMQYSPYWEQYTLKDNKYVWGMDLPQTFEGIKFANTMYNEGLLAKEQTIFKSNEATNKLKIGEVGILMSNTSDYVLADIYKNFEATFPNLKAADSVKIMKVLGPSGKMWGQFASGIGAATMFSPKLSDGALNRVLNIFDWIASDEGKDTIVYGIEGQDYNIVNGEKVFVNSNMKINGGNPLYSKAMVLNVTVPSFIKENLYGKDIVSQVEDYKQFLKKQDTQDFRKYDYNLYFFNGENYSKNGSFYFDGSELIKRLIVGSPEKLESDWNSWKESVRPKVNIILDDLNQSIK